MKTSTKAAYVARAAQLKYMISMAVSWGAELDMRGELARLHTANAAWGDCSREIATAYRYLRAAGTEKPTFTNH